MCIYVYIYIYMVYVYIYSLIMLNLIKSNFRCVCLSVSIWMCLKLGYTMAPKIECFHGTWWLTMGFWGTLLWIMWMEEILRQMVDGLSHSNLIVIIYNLMIYTYQLVQGIPPSAFKKKNIEIRCYFHDMCIPRVRPWQQPALCEPRAKQEAVLGNFGRGNTKAWRCSVWAIHVGPEILNIYCKMSPSLEEKVII